MTKLLLLVLFSMGCSTDHVTSTTTQGLPSGGTGCSIDEETGVCRCLSSPIIVDVAGDGYDITTADDGVWFRLQAGRVWKWAWTSVGDDDSFLALDVNHDGVIGDGSELFGDGSLQGLGTPNGFSALAVYDGDDDGAITPADPIWDQLRLWNDRDHDGVSRPSELIDLSKARVRAISVGYSASAVVDMHGNEFRFAGHIDADAPMAPTVYDVWLTAAVLPVSDRTTNTSVIWTCKAWAYAISAAGPIHESLPCFGPGTGFDPIMLMTPDIPDYPVPAYATLVSRTASAADDKAGALRAVVERVTGDIDNGVTCYIGVYKAYPDPQGNGPYDWGSALDSPPNLEPRAMCTAVTVEPPPTSTGGC